MNRQNLSTQLEQYGLGEAEAKIYLYLLEHGPQTALQLSRSINVDRSKIYRSIEIMISKKFLEQTHAAWGKRLQAASPKNIALFIQDEEEALKARKEALPKLLQGLTNISSYTKREFEVKHYRGQEGLRQMLWNQLAADKEILAFSHKNKNDIAGKTYAEKIRATQLERKITLYELDNLFDQNDHSYTAIEGWLDYYKCRYVSPKILNIKQYMAIFNHTVSIINWLGKEEVGLEIINTDYAEMQRQLFWKFWEIAGQQV